MTVFTLDLTSPEAADVAAQLATDLNEFLDDTGYLHYAAGPTEVRGIAEFLLQWFSGGHQKRVIADAQQRTIECGDVLAKLIDAREQSKEPFCMPQFRRQTSETQ